MRLARLRHVPVASDGVLRGVLSYRRLLEAWIARQLGEGLPGGASVAVARVMDAAPASVGPRASLAAAAAILVAANLGCVPVVETRPEGLRMVGLVTEGDLLRVAYDPVFSGWGG
jgi:CBS domain-containing protein